MQAGHAGSLDVNTMIYMLNPMTSEPNGELTFFRQTMLDKMETKLTETSTAEKVMSQHMDDMKTEVTTIKTGLTGYVLVVLCFDIQAQYNLELLTNDGCIEFFL